MLRYYFESIFWQDQSYPAEGNMDSAFLQDLAAFTITFHSFWEMLRKFRTQSDRPKVFKNKKQIFRGQEGLKLQKHDLFYFPIICSYKWNFVTNYFSIIFQMQRNYQTIQIYIYCTEDNQWPNCSTPSCFKKILL